MSVFYIKALRVAQEEQVKEPLRVLDLNFTFFLFMFTDVAFKNHSDQIRSTVQQRFKVP